MVLPDSIYFPSLRIKKIYFALLGALVCPAFRLIEKGIIEGMSSLNLDASAPQDVLRLWNEIGEVPGRFLNPLLKLALFLSIVIISPLIEEYLFRGCLYSKMRQWMANPDSTINRSIRIVANGVLFGACHLSGAQGWFNIPLFVVLSLGGCLLTVIREKTGSVAYSALTHSGYNGMYLFLWLRGW